MAIIRPCTELRNNFTEILRLCEENHEPVFITQNGYGKLVVLTIEDYRADRARLELLRELEKGKQAVLDGRVTPLRDFQQEIGRERGKNG